MGFTREPSGFMVVPHQTVYLMPQKYGFPSPLSPSINAVNRKMSSINNSARDTLYPEAETEKTLSSDSGALSVGSEEQA